jgi:hypothetical protein
MICEFMSSRNNLIYFGSMLKDKRWNKMVTLWYEREPVLSGTRCLR